MERVAFPLSAEYYHSARGATETPMSRWRNARCWLCFERIGERRAEVSARAGRRVAAKGNFARREKWMRRVRFGNRLIATRIRDRDAGRPCYLTSQVSPARSNWLRSPAHLGS